MLKDLKLMLGIAEKETDLDEKLQLILNNAKARLRRRLGNIDPPDEMNDIIIEVAIMRFNRIGSEGLANHSFEGESLAFTDKDFDGFADEIQAWLDTQKDSTIGKVRFI
jgi:hypothetical protein